MEMYFLNYVLLELILKFHHSAPFQTDAHERWERWPGCGPVVKVSWPRVNSHLCWWDCVGKGGSRLGCRFGGHDLNDVNVKLSCPRSVFFPTDFFEYFALDSCSANPCLNSWAQRWVGAFCRGCLLSCRLAIMWLRLLKCVDPYVHSYCIQCTRACVLQVTLVVFDSVRPYGLQPEVCVCVCYCTQVYICCICIQYIQCM